MHVPPPRRNAVPRTLSTHQAQVHSTGVHWIIPVVMSYMNYSGPRNQWGLEEATIIGTMRLALLVIVYIYRGRPCLCHITNLLFIGRVLRFQ